MAPARRHADLIASQAGPETHRLTLSGLLRDRPAQAILAAIGLKVALDIAYAQVVPSAAYYALMPTQFSGVKLAEGYLLVVIGLLALPRELSLLSSMALWLIAILLLVPMTTIYAFQDQPRTYMYATVGFFVLAGATTRLLPDMRLPQPGPRLRRGGTFLLFGLMIAVATVVLIVYAGTSLLGNITRLGGDLGGAYVDRANFVAAGIPLKGYYFHWLALVFNPVLLVLAVLRRKWWAIPILGIFQLLIGAEVGARSYFLDLPFILPIALLARGVNPPRIIAWVGAAAVIVSAAFFLTTHHPFVFNFVAGRFLLVPSQLNFIYYNFFSTHGQIPGAYIYKFFFRFNYPLQYPFGDSPPFVIGKYYYHDRGLFAISGILGDTYMNLGLAGMAVGAIALGFALRLTDSVAEGLDRRVAMAAVVYPSVAVTGTFLIRVIFTTGLVWMYLLLYLMPRPEPAREAVRRAQLWPATGKALKLLLLSQYFPPEVGAAQTRLFNFARALLAAGHECRVLTAMPNYPAGRVADGYRGRLVYRERIEGVPVIRTPIFPVRSADARRLLSYASFQLASLPTLWGTIGRFRPDYLFIESPPLFLGLTGVLVKAAIGLPYIFNVADLWPDWAVEMGAIRRGGPMHRIGLALESLIYRHADFVTIVVPGMAEALVAKGVPENKILLLPNGVDVESFSAHAAKNGAVGSATAERIRYDARGRLVVLYAGTLGTYHGLQAALEAAQQLKGEPVLLAFVGDGSERTKLLAFAKSLDLDNVLFYDPVPAVEMPALMAVATIALSVIKIPTRSAKTLPAMAAGIPIVYAGRGEGAALVELAGAGIVVDPDRPEEIARAITELVSDPPRAARLGAGGRRYAEGNLDWKPLVGAWLSSLSERSSRTPLAPFTPSGAPRTASRQKS